LTFWKKKKRGYLFYYYLWQYGAFFQYRKFVNSFGFDIVQHLTFANFAMPSLFMFCKPTTVCGPIGQATIPAAIFSSLPVKIKAKEFLRKCSIWFLCHFEPCRVLTTHCANWIIECGAAPGTSCFPKKYQKKILHHPQTGINSSEPEYRIQRRRDRDGKTRLLICSEFLHWKGVRYSAEVYARIASQRDDVELWIYGAGPEKKFMQAIFKKHKVEKSIRWNGFVSKQEMLQGLADADILLYPSYHHGLATVVLQAMFFGLPIVTNAGDSIALVASEGAGVVADGNTMSQIMDNLTDKTMFLIDHPEIRKGIGIHEQNLINQKYEWCNLTKRLSDLLQQIAE
jgi:glycosyltransferase involved in cell wall biosynthesis